MRNNQKQNKTRQKYPSKRERRAPSGSRVVKSAGIFSSWGKGLAAERNARFRPRRDLTKPRLKPGPPVKGPPGAVLPLQDGARAARAPATTPSGARGVVLSWQVRDHAEELGLPASAGPVKTQPGLKDNTVLRRLIRTALDLHSGDYIVRIFHTKHNNKSNLIRAEL